MFEWVGSKFNAQNVNHRSIWESHLLSNHLSGQSTYVNVCKLQSTRLESTKHLKNLIHTITCCYRIRLVLKVERAEREAASVRPPLREYWSDWCKLDTTASHINWIGLQSRASMWLCLTKRTLNLFWYIVCSTRASINMCVRWLFAVYVWVKPVSCMDCE